MASTKLSQLVVHPSRVASLLDWNKSKSAIMSISVSKGYIGVAISKHPSNWDHMHDLDSFQLKVHPTRRKGTPQVDTMKQLASQLDDIVQEQNVCAFLVDWPISNLGRCGASCGQTLFHLEKIIDSSDIISKSRPFAFVNYLRVTDSNDIEDTWGRIVNFGRIKDNQRQMVYRSKSKRIEGKEGLNKQNAKESLKRFFNGQYSGGVSSHDPCNAFNLMDGYL